MAWLFIEPGGPQRGPMPETALVRFLQRQANHATLAAASGAFRSRSPFPPNHDARCGVSMLPSKRLTALRRGTCAVWNPAMEAWARAAETPPFREHVIALTSQWYRPDAATATHANPLGCTLGDEREHIIAYQPSRIPRHD